MQRLCPALWLYSWEKLLEEIGGDTSKSRRDWVHAYHFMVLVQIFKHIKNCVREGKRQNLTCWASFKGTPVFPAAALLLLQGIKQRASHHL